MTWGKREPGEKVWHTATGKLITHGGSGNAYSNHGCRCQECIDANTERYKRRREERKALVEAGRVPPEIPHGTDATYTNWNCRCTECRAAHAEKCARYHRERSALRK